MLAIEDDCFVTLSNNEMQSSHVLVSLAHVVVIVLHNSAPLGRVEFESTVVGLDELII